MIDEIVNFLLAANHFEKQRADVEFTISDIRKYFIYKDNSHTLKIILPGWGSGLSWITTLLVRRLSRRGFSCLVYALPRTILPYNPNVAPETFGNVKTLIKDDIAHIKSRYNFKKIDIIAPSLGAVIACMVANDNKDIAGIFLIVPGSCLASSLWDGIRTQKLKQTYATQSIDKKKLKKLWHFLAPKNNISGLANKKIFLAISRSDKVIPYYYGKELADLLKELYPNTSIRENRYWGHYLTVVKYYVFGEELLKQI